MSTAVKWFAHVNTNATELERSLAFYRDTLGLSILWRTVPTDPQDGALFGRPGLELAWRGVLLCDHRGVRGPLLDLLEWTLPATGTARRPAGAAGFARLVFAGPDVQRESELSDPDGVPIRLVPTIGPPEFRAVEIICTDLARSARYYAGLGFVVEPADGRATVRLDGGRDTFRVLLREERAAGTHLHEPFDVGIHRLALVTDHIDAHDLPPHATGVHDVELGPGLGQVRATLFPDPDGTVLEYVERGFGTVPAMNP